MFEGRTLVGLAALVFAVEAAVSLAVRDHATNATAWRELIRITARTSVGWFVLAFAARPLVSLWPTPASKWLLRNRRYLGLGYAVSHGGHLIAILAAAGLEGAAFWDALAITTLLGGGFGYLILAAMAATSVDGAQRALGRGRWRALHLTGMWTFWVIFTSSYAPAAIASPVAAVAVVALLATAGLRLTAWFRSPRRHKRRGADE